jgi:hypothetical protein
MEKKKKSIEYIIWEIIKGFGIFITVLYLQPVIVISNSLFKEAVEEYKKEEIVKSWLNAVFGIAAILFVWFLSTSMLSIIGLFLWGFSKIIYIVFAEIFNIISVMFV